MSRRRTIERNAERHLAAVPPAGTTDKPVAVGYPVTVEIPTGGRRDLDGLIRELARVCFRSNLAGYEVKADGPRSRFFLTVQPMTDCGAEAIQEGVLSIAKALVVVGALQIKPQPVAAEEPKTEAVCPPPSSPES